MLEPITPRNSTLARFEDLFRTWDTTSQADMLRVLNALHRGCKRDRATVPAATESRPASATNATSLDEPEQSSLIADGEFQDV